MSQDDIFTRVQKIVKEQLEVELSKVTPEANFATDLGADSLDTVELVMALEEEFDIEIPDEEAEGITTVQACVDYINGQTCSSKSIKYLSFPLRGEKLEKWKLLFCSAFWVFNFLKLKS